MKTLLETRTEKHLSIIQGRGKMKKCLKKQRDGSRITKQICPGVGTEKTKVSRFS